MQDAGLCGKEGQAPKVVISGLGLPSQMVSFAKNGCAPEFALWSFVDLGYLTYYATYMLYTGAIQGKKGEQFEAGRMGIYTIEKDPNREAGLVSCWVSKSTTRPTSIRSKVRLAQDILRVKQSLPKAGRRKPTPAGSSSDVCLKTCADYRRIT